MNEKSNSEKTFVVSIVERYGQIIGVYRKMEDAVQVASASIAKGQVCNIITKPVL